MKKILFFSIILIFFLRFDVFSQNGECLTGGCGNFDYNFPTAGAPFSTSVPTWTIVNTGIWAGDWTTYSVVNGSTYEWSLLAADGGSASYDSRLTLWNSTGTTAYCFSDNYNSTDDGKIRWTATFTGTVRVLVSFYQNGSNSCVDNSTATTLVWRCASCAAPILPCTCTDATLISTLPYTGDEHTTCGMCDTYDMDDACGNKYMNERDRLYTYTPATSGWVNITLSDLVDASNADGVGLFLFDGCPDQPSTHCVGASTKQYPSFLGNPTLKEYLTAGVTYYVMVSSGTPGSLDNQVYNADACINYDISVTNTTTPVPNTKDCAGARVICGTTYTEPNPLTGEGNYPAEINSATSCLDGEINSAWYIFTVQTTGTLTMTINPDIDTEDYDWAVFNLTGKTCDDIFGDPSMEVSSNYSGTTGNTGIDGSTSLTCGGALDSPWNDDITVTAGNTYAIYVSNWNSTDGYVITLGGTANYIDNVGPQLDQISSAPACGQSSITVLFSENILCSSVSASDFTLTGSGGPYTITSVTSPICTAGGTYDKEFTVTFTPALTSGGTYTLNLVSSVSDVCSNATTLNSLSFQVAGVTSTLTATNPLCFGQNGSATAVVTGGTPPYTYDWSPNGYTGDGSVTYSNIPVGTYTLTVTDNLGVCQSIQSIAVENRIAIFEDDFDPSPTAGWLTGAITGVNSWATGDPMGGNGSTGVGKEDPTSDHTSTNADNNVYGQGLGSGTLGGYNNSTNDFLRTPAINCTGATGTRLEFWRWANFETSYDEAYVEISTNGTTWTDLLQPQYPQENVWTYVSIDISAYADNQPTVYVRWRADTDGSVTYSGWNIDDVKISKNLTAISGTTSVTNVACNGASTGAIDLTPTGGSGTYSGYSWTGGATTQDISAKPAGTYTVTITDNRGCTGNVAATITQPALALSISASQTNVLCYGNSTGAIDITPSGGTPAYSYSWTGPSFTASSQDISSRPAGTYNVTVTDANNCTATASYTITQPASGISVSLSSQTDVSCFGGSDGAINISASGGTPPLSYNWGGGIVTEDRSGLSAGTYTVTVSDNSGGGCTATLGVTISQPAAALSVSVSKTDVLCNGGSTGTATATVTGGTSAYSYNWTPGNPSGDGTNAVTGLTAGVWSCAVTDAKGCTANNSVTVTQPATALSITLEDQTNVTCNGLSNGAIDITPTGGTSGYTYSWTGPSGFTAGTQDITSRPAGTYFVTVMDANSCVANTSYTITQPNELTLAMSKTDATCNGDDDGTATATPTGGTLPYNYHWDDADFQSTQTASGLTSGTYNITVTDANSCQALNSITVNQPVAIVITTGSTQSVCLGSSGTASVSVFSGGVAPFSYDWTGNPTGDGTANISGLASGVYFVTVSDDNGCEAVSSANVTDAAGPSASITAQTNVSCFGGNNGEATVSITSGGTAPFDYVWSTGSQTLATASTLDIANGLTNGVHTVDITDDNGCSVSASVTITQPAVLNAAVTSQTNVACFGASTGSATITINGGTPNYNYNWPAPIVDANNTASLTNTANNLAFGSYVVTITDNKSCLTTATVSISQPTDLTASIDGTDVSCFGGSNGSADLTPGGGVAPYTYLWSNTSTNQDLTNVGPGDYQVTVTDANFCTETASVTLTQPATALDVTMSSDNVDCFNGSNGSATANLVGGTSPYTYLWSNGNTTQTISSLSPATYTVTVTDDNGCIGNGSVAITQPAAALQGTISGTNINCFGQSTGVANLTVTGGTTIYSYNWSNGASTEDISGVVADNYSVTITDANSCQTTAAVTLTQPAAALTASINGTDVSCFGGADGEADLIVNGGTAPYTYLWTNASPNQDLTNLTATNYTVTVTDNNACTTTASVTISQPAAALTSSIVGTNITCNAANNGIANLTVSGGTSPYAYLWGGGQTTEDLSGLSAGTYSVTATDDNGCTSTSAVTITEPAVLNATANKTNVSCNGLSDGTATVIATGGTTPYSYSWNSSPVQNTQSASGLPAGVYTVVVTDANSCTKAATVTITEPAVLTASIVGTNVSCNGLADADADLTVSGGNAPYTYVWSNGYTGQDLFDVTAGTYSVIVTDNRACTANASVDLTQPTILSATYTSVNVACRNGSTGSVDLTVAGGVTPYSYNWNIGQTTEDLTNIAAGTYTGTVTDANFCSAYVTITISQPAAVLSASTLATNVTCNGVNTGAINLTVTGGTMPYSYNWSDGNTGEDRTGLAAGTYIVTVTDNNMCNANATVTITQPDALSATIAPTHILCNGASTGQANLSVTGGTTPYSFSWSNSTITEDLVTIVAGSYDVTITDFYGCETSANTTINQPTLIVLTPSSTNSTCGSTNGTASVSVAGGISPYTYNWNGTPTGDGTPDITGLASGAYSVTVTDANGCQKIISANVNDAGAPTISIASLTNVDCFGNANGEISVNVTGGVTPYSYSWSIAGNTDSQTGLSGGTYSVTVVDANNCSANISADITEPAALNSSIVGTNINCNSGSNGIADLTVTGGTTPYSYLWNSGSTSQDLTSIAAGNYSVVVTDANSCVSNAAVTISEPAQLVASISASTNATAAGICDGTATVGVVGGTSPYIYTWSNSQTSSSLSGLCAGVYTVTVTDSKNCTSVVSVTISEPGTFSLSYTQTNNLCFGNTAGSVDLTVSGGTTPYVFAWSNGANTEDLSSLGAGTYTVTVTDANSYSTQTTVIITQPANLTSNIVKTNVSCFGGSNGAINLTVNGGVAPYTFIWSNGSITEDLSALVADIYTVTITDNNGCQINASAVINEPATAVSATSAITNVSCYNNATGAIDLSPSGGNAPYTYVWSNGAITQDLNLVMAGAYDVTVTDFNACTFNASFIITQPVSGLSIVNIVGTDVLCYNASTGSADLTISGGTSPFIYNWSYGYTTEDLSNVSAGIYDVTVTDNNSCYANGSVTISQPAAPITIVTSQTNSTCGNADGTATISVTGGTISADYSYDWSGTPIGDGTNAISGLSAGTYVITVTDDNSCTKVGAVYISDIGGVDLAVIKLTDVDCNGNANGSAMAVATGGTSPYTYLWSTGGTTDTEFGLSGGTVILTLTDAVNCVSIDSVTVNEPNALTLTAIISDVACFGTSTGSIDLTVTGGSLPYTYQWSNAQTTQDNFNLIVGAYDITVTDNHGCTINDSYSVSEPVSALSLSTVGTNVSCYNGTNGAVDLTVAGGTSPYIYYWNYGQNTQDISGLFATVYSVTVFDVNSCEASANVTITQPATINLSIISSDVLCSGDATGSATATVFGGTAPYNYLWNDALSQTTNVLSNVQDGTYVLTVTDSNGCAKISSVTVNEPTPLVVDLTTKDIKCKGDKAGAIFSSVSGGKTTYSYLWSVGSFTTSDINNQWPGVYSVTVTDANNCSVVASATITEPALVLSASASVNNVSCKGGNDASIDLLTDGGTPGYTYLWNYGQTTEDISGLSDGYYAVTIYDANGCMYTSSFIITEPNTLLNTVVTKVDATCGQTNGSADVTAVGGTSPYTYLWSTGETSTNATNLAGGVHTVTVTDLNGCTNINTVTITQPNDISIAYTSQDVTCYGQNTGSINITVSGGNLGSTGYSFDWSNASVNEDISSLASGSYCVTVTDADNCEQTECITINQPVAAISVSEVITDVSCYGGNDGSIDITPVGGVPPYTFVWNYGQVTEDITNRPQGYHSVNIFDANGCILTASYTINQPANALSASFSVVQPACGLSNGSAWAVPAGGTSPYVFEWETGDTNDTITDLSAGDYTLTITDANLCTFVQAVNIQDISNPIAIINSSSNVTCNGAGNGSATVLAADGTPPYNYLWDNNDVTANASNLSAGVHTVTVSDLNGCSATASVTITEPNELTSGMEVTAALCYGDSTGAINISVYGGTAPFVYAWNSGQSSQDISHIIAGTYHLTITDANGCQIVAPDIVVGQPAAPLSITSLVTNVNCNSMATGSIDITISGGTIFAAGTPYLYSWNYGQSTEDVTDLVSGVYEVTVTDNNACKLSQIFVVTQPEPISIEWTTVACNCGQTDGSATIISMTGGVGPYTWIWSNGIQNQMASTGLAYGSHSVTVTDSYSCSYDFDVTIQNQGFNPVIINTTQIICYGGFAEAIALMPSGIAPFTYVWSNSQTTQTAYALSEGSYSVTVVDNIGCSGIGNTSVMPAPSQLTATIEKTNVTCKGLSDGTATVHVDGGTQFASNMPYSYLWTNASASTDSVATGLSPNISYNVVITDANGCILSKDVIVTEPAKFLQAFMDTTIDVTCFGGNDGIIQVEVSGGTSPYDYSWSDGQNTPAAVQLVAGQYFVTVTDANNCSAIDTISIAQPTEIEIEYLTEEASCVDSYDGTIKITVTGGVGPYTYAWNTTNIETGTEVTGLHTGDYVVSVTDDNQCVKEQDIYVSGSLEECLEIPSAFTPNGDGVNDTWFIKGIDLYPEANVEIFNRWGEKLFSTKGYANDWDGTYNGNPLPHASYVYILTFSDRIAPKTGTVTIIR
jgi:gliding motility-associated-like protein